MSTTSHSVHNKVPYFSSTSKQTFVGAKLKEPFSNTNRRINLYPSINNPIRHSISDAIPIGLT